MKTIGGAVTRGVLGAGMLVMPPVVLGLAGSLTPWAWGFHLLLGGAVALVLALLVRQGARPAPLSVSMGELLGTWAARSIDGVFAVAFTAGQAAIAWFAASYALAAASGGRLQPANANGLLLALGILATALGLALAGVRPAPLLLRIRPWATGALAMACAAAGWPIAAEDGSPLGPPGTLESGGFWTAVAVLFFAGVGWETVTTAVPGMRARRSHIIGGVLFGTVAVAGVYLGIAVVHQRMSGSYGEADRLPAWSQYVLAGAVVILAASYCFTNIRTASVIASRLRAGEGFVTRPVTLIIGLMCAVFACVGMRAGGVPLLLLGPAVAALTGYSVGMFAAVKRGGRGLSATAGVVLLTLLGSGALVLWELSGVNS
ncbi:amino acid:polyamine antiporter [Streptomyces gobiensis]|uniref:amino acid:polyamine antiporter n=1 Tax=Streptomyces gobiensis TaxID=2875706 RepID=UPI001E4E2410|nr:amino acid:polyamine antiporter [Streptomyces gobiensis]UGY91990.1 amino acid:polyamine antiporter [Streptomyces gobiensis]